MKQLAFARPATCCSVKLRAGGKLPGNDEDRSEVSLLVERDAQGAATDALPLRAPSRIAACAFTSQRARCIAVRRFACSLSADMTDAASVRLWSH